MRLNLQRRLHRAHAGGAAQPKAGSLAVTHDQATIKPAQRVDVSAPLGASVNIINATDIEGGEKWCGGGKVEVDHMLPIRAGGEPRRRDADSLDGEFHLVRLACRRVTEELEREVIQMLLPVPDLHAPLLNLKLWPVRDVCR